MLIHHGYMATDDITPSIITLLLIIYAIVGCYLCENFASPFLALALIITIWWIKNYHEQQKEKWAALETLLEKFLGKGNCSIPLWWIWLMWLFWYYVVERQKRKYCTWTRITMSIWIARAANENLHCSFSLFIFLLCFFLKWICYREPLWTRAKCTVRADFPLWVMSFFISFAFSESLTACFTTFFIKYKFWKCHNDFWQ